MIVNTVTNDYEFYEWLQNSDNYKDKFTLEGAKQLQQYYEDLSEELNESIEFDPIDWLCEYSEYRNLMDYNKQNDAGYKDLDTLANYTIVIKFDSGILVGNF
jgi:hypothetical protein